MRNLKSKISFEDCTKFDYVLYYGMEGVHMCKCRSPCGLASHVPTYVCIGVLAKRGGLCGWKRAMLDCPVEEWYTVL